MAIDYVDPNGDGTVTSYWYDEPMQFNNYYQKIDDAVREPLTDSITTTYLYLDYDHWVGNINFHMTTLTVLSVTKIKVWIYARKDYSGSWIKGDISKDGISFVGEQNFNITGSAGWHSITFDVSGSPWNQTDLNGLQVKLYGNCDSEEEGDRTIVYAMYVEVTYTTAPEENPYPTSLLKKGLVSGYHCFMNAYLNAKVGGYDPLKLPDGTLF